MHYAISCGKWLFYIISGIIIPVEEGCRMCRKYTPEELNKLDMQAKDDIIYDMQERLDKLEHSYEQLIEQVKLANQQRFGQKSEKLNSITGQLSFFNEAEACYDENGPEPSIDDVVESAGKKPRRKKQKGQREEDLKEFPQEEITHDVPEGRLNDTFGEGSWKSMPDEIYWQLRFEPARWIAEKHIVKVYLGTDGEHQDEFLRGDHPKKLFRGSIATESLIAAIANTKYVNSNPLDRISRDFKVNGLNLSKQTMSNWMVNTAERYFKPVYEYMIKKQLTYHVNQCDETPVEVIKDGRPPGSQSYMWVHRTGELSPGPPIIVYEYQKTRNSSHPKEYYKDFKGVLETDGLEQYHKTERETEGLTNANCYAHARRDYADAIKIMGKSNPDAIKKSIAYQALVRIGSIYDLEGTLKDLTPEERLKERQKTIKPLVEEYFRWVREKLSDKTVLPKGKTAQGLNYSINQEKYLKVFLTDGEVPIDNSASERALRNFTIGRKNWVTMYTPRGAEASAIIYSITETARANNKNVYYYIKYLLEELLKKMDDNGNIADEQIEPLMPWSDTLPAECQSKRRD